MKERGTPAVILLAEDDDDDYTLIRDALQEARVLNPLLRVKDGVELLEYLRRQGAFADPEKAPAPSLILIDLNMPRKDGRTALKEMKEDRSLRGLPVVVLTTSKSEEDVLAAYDIGASTFIRKPVTFEGLVEVARGLGRYWFEIVELPRTS
ncbi:MAG: response regulator [Candidatus Polarisedimenticolia bacterium]